MIGEALQIMEKLSGANSARTSNESWYLQTPPSQDDVMSESTFGSELDGDGISAPGHLGTCPVASLGGMRGGWGIPLVHFYEMS